MLILNQQDLSDLLKMREVIEAVESGFRAMASGAARAPERLHLEIPSSKAVVLEMPALIDDARGALGTKIVSVFESNSERGLDVVQAMYLLLDHETGEPLAMMEGRFITGIRTAATSAVATKHMAKAGPKQLAIFGAGVQARFHIEAMAKVATVERIMISSRSAEKAFELAALARARYQVACDVVAADEAASTADLICTCTSSPSPLFDGRLVKPGAHINAVGAFTPTTRELDTEIVKRARVIIDAQSAAGREAGEVLIPIAAGAVEASHIKGTLADVVSGKVAGRNQPNEVTLFKSCGLAIEDLVTARLAFEKAKARNMGLDVKL